MPGRDNGYHPRHIPTDNQIGYSTPAYRHGCHIDEPVSRQTPGRRGDNRYQRSYQNVYSTRLVAA
jgi:hypothetical protein